MTRRTMASLTTVLVLGSLTACGGDSGDDSDDSAASGSSSPPVSSSAPATSATTAPSPTATTPSPTAEPSASPDASPTGDDKRYCDAVAKAQRDLADTASASDKSVRQVASAIDEITRLAPSDVRQQWQLIQDTVAQVRAATRKAGIDLADLTDPKVLQGLTPRQQQALSKGLGAVDTTGLPQANEDITKQVAQLCGVTLSPGGAVPTP